MITIPFERVCISNSGQVSRGGFLPTLLHRLVSVNISEQTLVSDVITVNTVTSVTTILTGPTVSTVITITKIHFSKPDVSPIKHY